jgi:hypothetical protein
MIKKYLNRIRVVSGTEQKNRTSPILPKGLPILTPEMDCDQMALGLPVTSAVFLVVKTFW